MLICARQITRLDALGHVGGQFAGVLETRPRQRHIYARALPIPICCAYRCSGAQLRAASPARRGSYFGSGEGCSARTFARQPDRNRDADLVLTAPAIAVQLIGFSGYL